VIAPHLPKPYSTGRPREWSMREIVNGIFYVMRAGCPWRLMPNDLPPWVYAGPVSVFVDPRAR
jgi:transposase